MRQETGGQSNSTLETVSSAAVNTDQSRILSGKIELNDQTILDGETGFSTQNMQNVVRKKLKNKPITSLRMTSIDCS